MHLSTHQDISLGLKIVHVHHLEKHLMGLQLNEYSIIVLI